MKLNRLVWIALLAIAATLVVASQALAASSDGSSSADASKVVTELLAPGAPDMVDGVPASMAQGAFVRGKTVTLPVSSVPFATANAVIAASSAPSGCKNAGVNSVQGKHPLFGYTLWKIWNHTHWCWSNWKVTQATGYYETYVRDYLGWAVYDRKWGKSWWNQPATMRTYATARFCLGQYFACLDQVSPVVQIFVNGAGHYSDDRVNWL